jgi:two-component system response regulator CpxR
MTTLQIPLPTSYRPITGFPFGRNHPAPAAAVQEDQAPRHVLVVSADNQLSAAACEALTRNGFEVTPASDGTRGLAECLNGSYQLVIVDAVLPVLDGLAVVHELRSRSTVPVLLIADSEEQCKAALDAGADDFVLRSASPGEILTRLHVIMRRTERLSHAQAPVLQCDDLCVNVKTQEAFAGDQALQLTNIEFAILKCLIRSAGKIVSRDELAAVLYQRKSPPYDRFLDVHISHLRKKLDLNGRLIRTVRGVGYLFTGAK